MRAAKVFLHPALVANENSMIDVLVVVGHSGGIRTRLSIASRYLLAECHFVAVGRTYAVHSVSPYVISRSDTQARDLAREAAQTCAVSRLVVGKGRVGGGAPADTA